MKYTFHINFDATDDQDALEHGEYLAQLTLLAPQAGFSFSTHEWDISGEDPDSGTTDWSLIVPKWEGYPEGAHK